MKIVLFVILLMVFGVFLLLGDWKITTFIKRYKVLIKVVKSAFSEDKTYSKQVITKQGKNIAQKVKSSNVSKKAQKAVRRMKIKFDHEVTSNEVIHSLSSKQPVRKEYKVVSHSSTRATNSNDAELDEIKNQVINRLKNK